ncbi:MAG: hypothetical protein JWP53_2439, partial [Conexibacter sp.]|nr:hypothetical protein [Conexibacter sp.]
MPDVDVAGLVDRVAGGSLDRRTLLVGAAGTLGAAALGGPARAAASATSAASRRP